jgi:hypothetical protein
MNRAARVQRVPDWWTRLAEDVTAMKVLGHRTSRAALLRHVHQVEGGIFAQERTRAARPAGCSARRAHGDGSLRVFIAPGSAGFRCRSSPAKSAMCRLARCASG